MTNSTISKTLSFEDRCFQWSSGFFLTDNCPDEYFGWDDELQAEWIDQHKWEPFEYWGSNDLCRLIYGLSLEIEQGKYPTKEETSHG